MKIKIIGLGGIGSVLSHQLSRFLNYSDHKEVTITLIDGDTYEAKNQDRQDFIKFGNKASTKLQELIDRFPDLSITSVEDYITEDNIHELIVDDDIVLMCVDNHKTRKLVSDHTVSLKDIILISGGNDYVDGNVQIFYRKEEKNLTPPLTDYHPEIAKPDDKSPADMSCEELAVSEPQLLFTNLSVAALMCQAFYNFIEKAKSKVFVSEVYFDMLSMNANAKVRKPLKA